MSLLDFIYSNPVQFANNAGLYALLSIIPLIIIYLLRPRPKKLRIPSLMFLFDLEKKKRLNIFRKFLKDPLFFIQLLVLILVSLAIAAPFIMANEEAGGGSTVIILDASGSMQAKTALGSTKFDDALGQAQSFLSAKNTIILAESVPLMVMQDAPSGSASDALRKLKAKSTETDLSSAILLGQRVLPQGGRIVVFSDFTSWIGDDPSVAKALAEANGITVDFVTVSGRTDNIGIVNGLFDGNSYTIVVKNFNSQAADVRIDVTTDNSNPVSSTLHLNGDSSQNFVISNLSSGTTKISISSDDALPLDNNAYVIIPSSATHDLLYITDNVKSPSVVALNLIPLIIPLTTVTKTDTKNIPSFSGYSIVFAGSPLPSDAIQSLSDYVKGGGNAVIIASPGLNDMDLLPVTLGSISNATSLDVVLPSVITDGIDINTIEVKKHFNATLKSGAVALVEGSDGSAILAYWKFGKGTVLYSGLADPVVENISENIYDPLNQNIWNDFHSHADYPLFWKQMFEWITGTYDVSEYNARTGQFIKLPATETIKTPTDTVTTDLLLLDEVGIYHLPDKDVAVNLYDETESNLAGTGITLGANQTAAKVLSTVQTIRKPEYFDIYLIIAGMFLVFLELYYLHWRGEL